jgi:hypothetical protein
MIPRRSGVILAFGAPGDRSGPMRDYYLGGTQVAFDAIETIRRQLAIELGPHGVRVVTLASGGVPESLPDGFEGRGKIVGMIEGQTLLARAATLEDVGNAAASAASDWARSMTAAIVNVAAVRSSTSESAEGTLPLCICDRLDRWLPDARLGRAAGVTSGVGPAPACRAKRSRGRAGAGWISERSSVGRMGAAE